ncbi:hypothetical protein AB0I55_12445 [Actinocatenispora sera]|uniref:hypothetical protein n=1 Tax=Actinocatenispora sera TaxID=390989 RepID=UPI0033E7E43A
MTSPPTALLTVNASNPNFSMGLVQPEAVLDGWPIRLSWGWNQLPVRPGRHRLRVQARAPLRAFGSADLILDAHPGQRVVVYYASPYVASFVWSQPGAIGFAPVQSSGRTAALVSRLVPAGIALLMMLVIGILVIVAMVLQ